ncbi:uncharacterized protein SCHCODRAFT_02610381 [Schizophyllum commune H4-8]|uniref:uncharacterized protein n=1 Tax=Schizophyllum commune (strain H4-8 / FGSC 9210) TaxID=578458 RepID=UPI00215E0340|nr:uncharacterized protein SCHCODRAFT_02610381 [Schizophyllum commune H4-8]KAI5897834.1 hypothetical protein SCHCODRAFT_02610381 [Schizophyllum commune H4-8]
MKDHSKEEAEGTPPPVDLATARERCGQLEYECTDEAFMAKLMSPRKRPGALSKATHFFDSWQEFEEWKAAEEVRLDVTYIKRTTYTSTRKGSPWRHTLFVCSRQRATRRAQYRSQRAGAPHQNVEGNCNASINVRIFDEDSAVHVAYAPCHSHDSHDNRVRQRRRKRRAPDESASPSSSCASPSSANASLSREPSSSPSDQALTLDLPLPVDTRSTHERLHEAVSLFAELYERVRGCADPLPSFEVLEDALSQLQASTTDLIRDPSISHVSSPTSTASRSPSAGAEEVDDPLHPHPSTITVTNTISSMTMSQRWMKAAQTLAVIRHLSTLSELPDPAVTLLEASLFQLFLESIAISSPEGPAQTAADLQHLGSQLSA